MELWHQPAGVRSALAGRAHSIVLEKVYLKPARLAREFRDVGSQIIFNGQPD